MPASQPKHAISPTRAADFPEWYQRVVQAADLAELAHVRGCMVIKPWGFGIWEQIQRVLDREFKRTGHENAYFPLLIPISYLAKEAEHVEGFAKEMAVVTHHRLEEHDGSLRPAAELAEPLVVRPTSETIIGQSLASWIQSYRDLPMRLNQWGNALRWEMRPRVFLRTTEFLWQEGHTAHATEAEALEHTRRMLEVYRGFAEDHLAIPVIPGDKPPHERFPGAEQTLTIEAMMQDGKALQSGTSHYLAQNFARSAGIEFTTREGGQEHVYTTSFGMSTRAIGALIMVHGDDDGLRLPPRIAPAQVVIVTIHRGEDTAASVDEYAERVRRSLEDASFAGEPLRVRVDGRDRSPADRRWEWIAKGAPLILEVGPRDVAAGEVTLTRRDGAPQERASTTLAHLEASVGGILGEIQAAYYGAAQARMSERTCELSTLEEMREFFGAKATIAQGGFVRAKWSGDVDALEQVADLALSVRCLPFDQRGTEGSCILTGRPATQEAIFARSY
jgi:prolyl-tRNA synthetase